MARNGRAVIAQELELVLHRCFAAAREARHLRVTLDHLVLAILSERSAADRLTASGVDTEKLRSDLGKKISATETAPAGQDDFDTVPHPFFQLALQTAILRVLSRGEKEVATLDVLKAILEQDAGYAPAMAAEAPQGRSAFRFEMNGRGGALRYVLTGAALGLAVPLVFRLLGALLDLFPGAPDTLLSAFDYLQLMLWPTPLLLVPIEEPGAPDLSAWGSVAIAALANVTVYATLAGLVWLGLAKSRWILAVPFALVAATWYVVWR
jgi:Clp amino terminal domain, pathogenicity island component